MCFRTWKSVQIDSTIVVTCRYSGRCCVSTINMIFFGVFWPYSNNIIADNAKVQISFLFSFKLFREDELNKPRPRVPSDLFNFTMTFNFFHWRCTVNYCTVTRCGCLENEEKSQSLCGSNLNITRMYFESVDQSICMTTSCIWVT